MAKNAMGHGSNTRGGPTFRSHHAGVKHPAAHQSGVRRLTRERKSSSVVVTKKSLRKAGVK